MTLRGVVDVVAAHHQSEGGGFVVRRPFPRPGIDQFDPFLLLDEMGPTDYGPGEAVGAPEHPHRGFETVTYMLSGGMEHRDSTGASGVIRPGAVQWMTAGAGIVHSELPPEDVMRDGGRQHGFQIWVNLRASDKMTPPHYQGFDADQLARHELEHGGVVRVIAGAVAGSTGPVTTTSPATLAHVTFGAGDQLVWEVPDGHTTLVHIFGGAATVNGTGAVDGQLVVLEHDRGDVDVSSTDGAEVLLMAGEPLREPIARYGPFVMNDRNEIIEAFNDFQSGRLGTVEAGGTGVTRS